MSDEAAVLAADDAFFAALREMFTGNLDPMKALWSHADDVVYMGPTSVLLMGWGPVLADWEKQAAMKLGGHIDPGERQVTVGEDIAVTHCRARGTNTDPQGNSVEFSLRGTNVFRKEGGQWKLIAHHSDPLPYLQQ